MEVKKEIALAKQLEGVRGNGNKMAPRGRRKEDHPATPFETIRIISFVILIATSTLGFLSMIKDQFNSLDDKIESHKMESEKRLTRLETIIEHLLGRDNDD
jgi:hypothetical protein